jgi:hypothetical protein
MKRTLFVLLLLVAVAFSLTAVAQTDILGPHNLNGHGCATCHAPHSGAKGNGGSTAGTGVTYLWGREFKQATYYTFGYDATADPGAQFTVGTSFSETDPLFHTAACLSCHDSGITGGGGGPLMTGVTIEATADGFNPPTYLATDGYSLQNDHPVHVAYDPTSTYNWPGTVTSGAITWTITNAYVANFANTYGHPVRFYADTTNNKAMVECSTCHNPHSMNWAKYKTVATTGYAGGGTGSAAVTLIKPSRFFIRGWYDGANTASNSATQFCRSCHYSKSNEYVNQNSTTN